MIEEAAIKKERSTETPPEGLMSLSKAEAPSLYDRGIYEKPYGYYMEQQKKLEKIWYRRNIGTYPKWLAVMGKNTARFIFRYFVKSKKLEIVFRGRGSRVKAAKIMNVNVCRTRADLPLQYASKVAIYVSITRRKR